MLAEVIVQALEDIDAAAYVRKDGFGRFAETPSARYHVSTFPCSTIIPQQ